jgi:hypothetical protein
LRATLSEAQRTLNIFSISFQFGSMSNADGVAESEAAGAPDWSVNLPCQSPVAGPFDVDCLDWKVFFDRGRHIIVAAIPVARVDDFLDGEKLRGFTRLPIRSSRQQKCTERNITFECMYGSTRGESEQARHGDDAWERMLMSGKRDAVALGHGCKKGCPYSFNLRVYSSKKEVAFIKYMVPKQAKTGAEVVLSMHHASADGKPVHRGLQTHVDYTADVRALVQLHLSARCAVRVIQVGVLLPHQLQFPLFSTT